VEFINRRKEKAFIYAFVRKKEFLYVGHTVDVWSRKKEHLFYKYEALKEAEFRILRQTTLEQALKLEAQIIRALKAKGQCRLNTITYSTGVSKPPILCPIDCSNGMRFRSIGEAARYFNLSKQTIRNRLADRTPVLKNLYIYRTPAHACWQAQPVPEQTLFSFL
jgi:hypothetical protein